MYFFRHMRSLHTTIQSITGHTLVQKMTYRIDSGQRINARSLANHYSKWQTTPTSRVLELGEDLRYRCLGSIYPHWYNDRKIHYAVQDECGILPMRENSVSVNVYK